MASKGNTKTAKKNAYRKSIRVEPTAMPSGSTDSPLPRSNPYHFSDDRSIQIQYENQLRDCITKYRIARDLSESKMGILIGKSTSYIRSITSEGALPSMSSMFDLIELVGITPAEFFRDFCPMDETDRMRVALRDKLEAMSPDDLQIMMMLADRLLA